MELHEQGSEDHTATNRPRVRARALLRNRLARLGFWMAKHPEGRLFTSAASVWLALGPMGGNPVNFLSNRVTPALLFSFIPVNTFMALMNWLFVSWFLDCYVLESETFREDFVKHEKRLIL